MKKIYFITTLLIALVIIISFLQFNGYLFNKNEIISSPEFINWQEFDNKNYNNESENNDSYNYSMFNDITDEINEIEGIENINYDIFITNKSIEDIIFYYSTLLEEDGYSYSLEYSGITPIDYYELNYFTFIKGLNGVVIFLKSYEKLTWVCYSSGSMLEYQNIINNIEL